MKLVSSAAVLMLAVLGVAAPALAEESEDHGLGLSAGIVGGTNGLGLEAGFRFNRFLGVRANTGDYKYDKTMRAGDDEEEDFDIKGTAKLKSVGAMVDVYPFGGSFRVSLGMRSNKNQFGGVATPVGAQVEVGDQNYDAADVGDLTGSAKFKKSAPMASLGWGGEFNKGLHFGVEVGLIKQGSAQINATASGILATDPGFQANLAEQVAEWRHDTKDYKYWPVFQLHLVYRF